MKKVFISLILVFALVLSACENKSAENIEETKDLESTESNLENESEPKVESSIFQESELKNKDYSNVISKIEYLDNGNYLLKVRIEQKDDIIFDDDDKNVYAEIKISSDKLDNSGIYNNEDIDKLYQIPLKDNLMPEVTEILIDKNSDIITKEEHEAIKNKDEGLLISVNIRDPRGDLLEMTNILSIESKD